MFDHDYIQDHQVVDRYLMGKLKEEEKAAFEDHYLDCVQCLDELEISSGLERDLKGIAAEEIVRVYRMGVLARFTGHRMMRLLSLTMIPVAVVALTLALNFDLRLSKIRSPQTPLLANLENYRGPSGQTSNQWVFEPSDEFVFLAQDLPVTEGRARLTIAIKNGKEVYKKTVKISKGTTHELIHRSLFSDGDYQLTVEILDDPANNYPLEFNFSVLKK